MRLAIPILLATLAAGSPAAAQAWSDPGLGVGASAGWSRGQDTGEARAAGELHVRARLTGGLALEGTLSMFRQGYDAGGERVLSTLVVPVQGSAILFLSWRGRVQPYLAGGIGYYYVQARGEGSNAGYGTHSENKFGFHGGGGLEARVTPRTSLQADVRYVSLDVDAAAALRERYGISPRASCWIAAAGATLYF